MLLFTSCCTTKAPDLGNLRELAVRCQQQRVALE